MHSSTTTSASVPLMETNQMAASPPRTLSLDKYSYWLDAIIVDDAQKVITTLATEDPEEKELLLNACFDFRVDDVFRGISKEMNFMLERPFSISLLLQSYEVAAELIKQGADVTLLEADGTNVVHQLVLFSCLPPIPDAEEQSLRSYQFLCENVSRDTLKELLMTEDDNGIRPIELAASKGSLGLFRAIFETPEIYMIRQETRGVLMYQWFDVTEYEGPLLSCKKTSRAGKSPLAFLAFMDQRTMEKDGTKKLFEWQPIKQWTSAKLRCNIIPTLLWCILRIAIVLCFFILVADQGSVRQIHQSRPHSSAGFCQGFSGIDMTYFVRFTIQSFTIITAIMMLLFDIIDISLLLIRKSPYVLYETARKSGVAVEYKFFRICQAILALLLTMFGLGFATGMAEPGSPVAYVAQMSASILACWSILYFVQLLPSVGIFVVTVQRMLIEMVHFFVVFALFVGPLAHFMLVFMNSDTLQGCIENYSDFYVTSYSSFTVMLNMEALRNYEVANPEILYLLHIVFVYIISVLLLNFLIANLSSAAARVYDNRELIVTLERLSIFHTVEFRFSRLFYFYYVWQKRKSFTMQDDKYCVTYATVIRRSSKKESY